MVRLWYGNDVISVRKKAMDYADSAVTNGVKIVRYDSDTYAPALVQHTVSATSLFGEREIVMFDMPSAHPEFWDEVVALLPDLMSSEEEFVIMEGQLTAPLLKPFLKAGVECTECKKTSTTVFNPFSLNEALLQRDKKTLWVLYQEAKRHGIAAEEIIGILWWQLKTVRLAARTTSAAEADVKEYPYKKAKQALKRFPPGVIEALSASLLEVYHDGHGGVRDIDVALEEWVLRV